MRGCRKARQGRSRATGVGRQAEGGGLEAGRVEALARTMVRARAARPVPAPTQLGAQLAAADDGEKAIEYSDLVQVATAGERGAVHRVGLLAAARER